MQLREHPLMSYRGLPNWPPVWTWMAGERKHSPKGEVGILQDVMLSTIGAQNRCFLIIEHDQATYMGCLLFDDIAFCRQLYDQLQGYCRRTIREIGDLDLGHLL